MFWYSLSFSLSLTHTQADFSQRDAFISVKEDDDLLMVAGLLKDHHRVAVINDKGQLSGMFKSI